jgi:plastocyanin
MDRTQLAALIVVFLAGWLTSPTARGASLSATVTGDDGKPVKDAVVYALPLDENGRPVPQPPPVVIDQVDKEYVPYVTPVRVGTAVSFPNHDQIRHHVYSFSTPKHFEIPLYRGTPRDPILFDKPGPVTLGCNIHDWMTAYVFVSETPYFALTRADGSAVVPDLPLGSYTVQVWHPRIKGEPESTGQRVSVADGADSSLQFTIEQRRVWRPRRSPSAGGGPSYR